MSTILERHLQCLVIAWCFKHKSIIERYFFRILICCTSKIQKTEKREFCYNLCLYFETKSVWHKNSHSFMGPSVLCPLVMALATVDGILSWCNGPEQSFPSIRMHCDPPTMTSLSRCQSLRKKPETLFFHYFQSHRSWDKEGGWYTFIWTTQNNFLSF